MKSLLSWVVANPFLYYALGLSTLLGFGASAAIGSGDGRRKWKSEWLFLALAGCTLFVWRCPAIIWPQPMNIDEGHAVACALKATHDFAPWRAFDGTTSGPLNFYILALPALFGVEITFFTTRMIACGLILSAIYGLYFIAKSTHGEPIARLAIVPPVAFLALTWEWDFLHYSSEYFPIFLTTMGIAAGTYLAVGERSKSGRLAACAFGGLLLGGAAFAKLQALPIALAAFGFMAVVIFSTRHRSASRGWTEATVLTAAFGLVPGAIAISLLTTGHWNDAVISYIKSAVVIVRSGTTVSFEFFFRTVFSYTAFALCSLVVIGLGGIAVSLRGSFTKRSLTIAGGAVAFLFVCLLVIFVPRHPFPHYLLFSVIPLSYALATVLRFTREADLWKGRERFVSAAIIAWFLVPALSLCMAHPSPHLGVVHDMLLRAGPDPSLPLPLSRPTTQVNAIKQYAPPGTRVAIWGWMPHYYVQTQTIMATRDSHTHHQLDNGPYQEYFRERFLADLRSQPPPVFIDVVAPLSWGYADRATSGFETFPDLAAFIDEHYLLKEDVWGMRIFVLKMATTSADRTAE
jgi:hypothetical protein